MATGSQVSWHTRPSIARKYLSNASSIEARSAAATAEAEVSQIGSRKITDTEMLQWITKFNNLSSVDDEGRKALSGRKLIDRRLDLKRLADLLKTAGYGSIVHLIADQFEAKGNVAAAEYLRAEALKP
jgi:hypothetical protein